MSLSKIFQAEEKKKLCRWCLSVASIEGKVKLVYKRSLKQTDYGFHVI